MTNGRLIQTLRNEYPHCQIEQVRALTTRCTGAVYASRGASVTVILCRSCRGGPVISDRYASDVCCDAATLTLLLASGCGRVFSRFKLVVVI